MVTYWLLSALNTMVSTFLGTIGSLLPSPPTFWTQATTAINTVVNTVPGPIMWFLPVGPVVVAGLSYFGIQVVIGGIALARRVLLAVIP